MLNYLSIRVAKIGPLHLHLRVPLRPRRRGGGLENGLLPVIPNQPKGLSGGAAAELEYDA